MRADHVIPIFDRPRYDAAADLLTLIAYPTDKKRRLLFARAIRGKQVKSMFNKDATWEAGIHPAHYTELPLEDFERNFRHGLRQINHRFIAAKAAMPFVQEAIANSMGKRVTLSGGRPLSKEEIFGRIAEQDGEKSPRSLATIWDNSMPVIHLAVALSKATPSSPELLLNQLLDLSPLRILKCANMVRLFLIRAQRSGPKRGPRSRPNFTDVGIYRVMWS